MTNEEAAKHLEQIREWAQKKIQDGHEPPWAWYQYMKLVETVAAILAGMKVTNPKENLPRSVQHQGTSLRLVESTCQKDTSRSHQDTEEPQMPM